MAAELRWILLGLSLPLLAAIWWWTARGTRQAPGNPELRESTPPLEARYADLIEHGVRGHLEPRDWGVPPFEPLNIRTAEFDQVPALDGPLLAHAEAHAEIHAEATPDMDLPAPPAAAAAPPPAADAQKIVTIRVCCPGEARWSGPRLASALEAHGLALGRFHVFHRQHPDGRSLFCVASLVEPGTFDAAQMPQQEFRGVTLFAMFPGPLAPLETMDELMRTARGLAAELSGMVQDGKGMPMSPQRAAALREEVARFQALLPRNTATGS